MPLEPVFRPAPPRRLRPPALAPVLAALAALFFLGGCDVQKSFLKIPVGGFWERLTPAADVLTYFPDWRGDGIVYSSVETGDFRVMTIRSDGSERRVYPGAPGRDDWTPRWVNDSLVVFTSSRSGSFDLWYLNVRSGSTSRLTAFAGHEVSPAPRPGKPGLAYAEAPSPILNGRIVLMPDTAAPSLNLHYVSPDNLKAGEPDWDPTGTRICFSAEGSDTTRHIWLATLSAGDTTLIQLTTGPYRDLSPRFSPDGAEVVFTSTRDGRSKVLVVSAAGEAAGLREVAVDDVGATVETPAWSSDGHSLVVSSNGRPADPRYPELAPQALWFLRNLGL